MIALRRIDHVCLRVADLDEAARRWCIQFGFSERRELRTADRAYLACGYEPYSLELWTSRGEPGHEHSAFELRDGCTPDDAAPISTRSAWPIAATRTTTSTSSIPRATAWSWCRSRLAIPTPTSARAPPTLPGFRARKLGHVNVLTGQLEAMRDFYRDVLGMGVTDYLGTEGVWLHINADHHVMALVGKTPAHFHHFALDLVDWGQLRVAFDHLGQHGRWLGWGPVRHALGQNLCGYVRIPDEHLFVELYCDMEVLDLPHTAREWRDDPRGSNLWGILPPRSYFRFDDAAVESERHQLEALGTPLPPL